MPANNNIIDSQSDLLYLDMNRYVGENPIIVNNDINSISFETSALTTVGAGSNISVSANVVEGQPTNYIISGKDWSNDIGQAIMTKLDASVFDTYSAAHASDDVTPYSAGSNINITNHVVSGKDWSSDISDAISTYSAAHASDDVTPYSAGKNINITNHVVNVANSIGLGTSNTISGDNILVVGSSNSVAANNNAVFGGSNTVASTKTDNVVLGQSNTTNNNNTVIIGNNLTTTKNNAVYIGQSQNTYTLNDNNGFGIVKSGRLDYVNNFPIPIVTELTYGSSFIKFYDAPADSYGVPFTLSYRYNSNGYNIRIGTSVHCQGKCHLDNNTNWYNFNANANTLVSSSPFVTTDNEVHELEIITWVPTNITTTSSLGSIGRYKFKLFNYTLNNKVYWVMWKDIEYHEEYIPTV